MEAKAKLLAGRTALVTGASRGIGRYVAQRLASAGATVVVTARSMTQSVARSRFDAARVIPGTLMETVDLITQAGGTAYALEADLLNPAQRDTLIARATETAGPIDILINNGGTGRLAPVAEMSMDVFDLTIDQYLRAPFALSKAAIPGMKSRGAGWIVNLGSVTALPPPRPFSRAPQPAGRVMYGAVKAALNRFTQGLAEELVHDNIAVNAVAPSTGIRTPGAAELFPPDYPTEDPAYICATVLAMCHRPAVERTGLVAYSMHYAWDAHLDVRSLDGRTRLPRTPPPAHAHADIPASGEERAWF
jgi:NAD(P)-dependent dehydrogenase (short-subunit alcohol dehydrogenase family)